MKQIPVGKKHFAVVDDEDYEDLIQFSWRLKCRQGGSLYAERRWYEDKVQRTETMHKRVKQPAEGKITDHWDGDGLNNQKLNLREVTKQQNSQNRWKKRFSEVCPYKGVRKQLTAWMGYIGTGGSFKHLGRFNTAEEAARAYDEAARERFGAFARLNFPKEDEQPAFQSEILRLRDTQAVKKAVREPETNRAVLESLKNGCRTGAEVAAWRISQVLTQKELGARLGLSMAAIQDWEQRQKTTEIMRILTAYVVRHGWLEPLDE